MFKMIRGVENSQVHTRDTSVRRGCLDFAYVHVLWYCVLSLGPCRRWPCVHLSICLSVCLSIYLSICLSIYLSIHPSIHLSIYAVRDETWNQSTYPYIHASVSRYSEARAVMGCGAEKHMAEMPDATLTAPTYLSIHPGSLNNRT